MNGEKYVFSIMDSLVTAPFDDSAQGRQDSGNRCSPKAAESDNTFLHDPTGLPLPGYENLHPLGRLIGPRLVFALVKTRANAEDGNGNEVAAAVSTPGR